MNQPPACLGSSSRHSSLVGLDKRDRQHVAFLARQIHRQSPFRVAAIFVVGPMTLHTRAAVHSRSRADCACPGDTHLSLTGHRAGRTFCATTVWAAQGRRRNRTRWNGVYRIANTPLASTLGPRFVSTSTSLLAGIWRHHPSPAWRDAAGSDLTRGAALVPNRVLIFEPEGTVVSLRRSVPWRQVRGVSAQWPWGPCHATDGPRLQ